MFSWALHPIGIIARLLGRNSASRQVVIAPATDGRIKAECSGCNTTEGHLHQLFCEYECCPFCGGQLASCDCCCEKLGLVDRDRYTEETAFLPAQVYNDGLPEDLEQKWCQILAVKGRVPFVKYPNVCAKCGELNPEFFRVSDAEWQKYVQIDMRKAILCKNCFSYIKHVALDVV